MKYNRKTDILEYSYETMANCNKVRCYVYTNEQKEHYLYFVTFSHTFITDVDLLPNREYDEKTYYQGNGIIPLTYEEYNELIKIE